MSKKHPLKSSSLILLLAIVAILVTFFIIKPHKEAVDKNQDNAQLLYPALDREQVIDIAIKSSDLELVLTRSAESTEDWLMDSAGQKYRADKLSVDGMLSSILASKKENDVNNVDASAVGLSPAKFSLQIPVGTPPKPRTLLLGDDTPVDYLVYAKWADQPTIFTTSRSLRFAIDKKIADLRNKKMLQDLKPNTVTALSIETTKKEGLTGARLNFSIQSESKTWQVDGKPDIRLDSAEIFKWINDLAATSAKTFLSENEKDRSKFGVASPVAFFKVTNQAGVEQKWSLGTYFEDKEKKDKKWALVGSGSPTIFEVTPTFVDNFKVDLFKFRDKKISHFESKDVKSITISKPDSSPVELSKKDGAWSILENEKNIAAKKEVVETVIRSLTELRADKFHESNNKTLGFAKPQRVVSVEIEGKADPVVLVFGKSLAPDEVAVKSSDTATPVSAAINLEKTLSVLPATYIDEHTSKSNGKKAKGESTKMEATVANLKDLKKLAEPITKPGYEYTAKIVLQDGKEFDILFDAVAAPYTVSNFLHLARNGFYNNVKFHRVIANFVAQGGDPTGTGAGGPGWKFQDESNNLTHERGSLSMANAGPNTNGSQFFIVLQPQPHLNGKHTVFGKVTKGLDQIDNIKPGDVMKTVEVFERAK